MSPRKKPTASQASVRKTPAARRANRADMAGRKRWPIVGAVVVVSALIALVAVSASHSGSSGAARSSAATANVSAGGGGVGSQATPFTLRSISGQNVSAPTAGRPGVIFFSESSCTSCIPSMRALSALKEKLGSRLSAVMVSVEPGDTTHYLRQWAGLVGHVPFPLTIDTTGNLVSAYQVQYLGTTIIYNAQGRIVDRADEPSIGELESGLRKAGLA